jgi:hypothetical protein
MILLHSFMLQYIENLFPFTQSPWTVLQRVKSAYSIHRMLSKYSWHRALQTR